MRRTARTAAAWTFYCVLAEVGGAEIPIAYCLVENTSPPQARSSKSLVVLPIPVPHPILFSIGFLRGSRATDSTQAALRSTKTHQRSLQWKPSGPKLRSSSVTGTLKERSIRSCVLPKRQRRRTNTGLEKRKKSSLTWRFAGDPCAIAALCPISFRGCQCPSRTESVKDEGRLEPRTKEEWNTVLEIMCRNFHLHPLIPDDNGTFKSSEMIYLECAREMYTWCKARGYHRLWAYLWINWYSKEQWNWWAQSADPSAIPTVKTTMIAESHWRTLKHVSLHRSNRPHVDLVVWILISRVLPGALQRLTVIKNGDSRIHRARWREAFKKHWKKERKKLIDPEKPAKYHTNPVRWICGCKAFLFSRFLICKHLIYCFETPSPEVF